MPARLTDIVSQDHGSEHTTMKTINQVWSHRLLTYLPRCCLEVTGHDSHREMAGVESPPGLLLRDEALHERERKSVYGCSGGGGGRGAMDIRVQA